MTFRKKTLMLLMVLSLWLAACGSKTEVTPAAATAADASPRAAAQIVAEGHLVPVQDVFLSFAVRGAVDEILVEEGETVHQGDVLARLGDQEQAQAALAAAQAELLSAQQAYDQFIRLADQAKAQAWQNYLQAQMALEQAQADWDALDLTALLDTVDEREADVRARKDDLDDAQSAFDLYADLDADNPTRKQAKDDLDKAQQDYHEALAAWQAAQRAVDGPQAALLAAQAAEKEARRLYEDLRDNGFDSEQKAALEARLSAAQAQVDAAQHTLAQYELRAPFDGMVTRINLAVGQVAGPELPVIQLADFSAWEVETSDLTELEVVKVRMGQRVNITPDALPDLTLTGEVIAIAPVFTSKGGDILYVVRIRLQKGDPALRWGMTVEADFLDE